MLRVLTSDASTNRRRLPQAHRQRPRIPQIKTCPATPCIYPLPTHATHPFHPLSLYPWWPSLSTAALANASSVVVLTPPNSLPALPHRHLWRRSQLPPARYATLSSPVAVPPQSELAGVRDAVLPAQRRPCPCLVTSPLARHPIATLPLLLLRCRHPGPPYMFDFACCNG